MKWIKVEDRLPEVNVRVLTYFISAYNGEGMVMPFSFNGVEWRDGAFTYRVTHWMPLPPPPSEDNNG